MTGRLQYLFIIYAAIILTACGTSRRAVVGERKFSREDLQKDYTLFRNVLEESHPSLYWFTSKDSMNYYFDEGFSKLADSMSERDFRTALSYVVSKMKCGHTAVRYSGRYSAYLDTARLKIFPVSVKAWADTIVVTANLNRRDSLFSPDSVSTHACWIRRLTGRVSLWTSTSWTKTIGMRDLSPDEA
ncbi:MAG: hypothetical protein EOP49_12185 [Sphingobacteriales bacterium]|nr:MAG: hypothetical protein EOP49_12185 [Sphingobacteriales bacterium]